TRVEFGNVSSNRAAASPGRLALRFRGLPTPVFAKDWGLPDLGIWGFTTIPPGVTFMAASIAQFMNAMLGLFNLGGGEIILILALILILFGAKKLPELAKGLGQGIKEFKKATREVTEEVSNSLEETPQKRLPPNPPVNPPVTQVEPSQTV